MSVTYEWDVEVVAEADSADYEAGEVIEHCHSATYREALADAARLKPPAGFCNRIVLVRDDDAGRSWAYIENGALPTRFTDADGSCATRVPDRFVKEVARNILHHPTAWKP